MMNISATSKYNHTTADQVTSQREMQQEPGSWRLTENKLDTIRESKSVTFWVRYLGQGSPGHEWTDE